MVIRDAQMQPLRMVGVNYDITERKQAEQALFESREDYRSLVESLDNVISKVDRDGLYRYVNPLGAAMMGMLPEQIIGKTMAEIFPGKNAGKSLARIQQVIDSGQGRVFEDQARLQNGQTVWGRVSVQPVLNAEGRAVQAVITSTDITDIKLAQQRVEESAARLQAANIELERALRAKDEFMAAMSHELRTPLTGIMGISEVLQMNLTGNLSEKQMRNLASINQSGERLLRLINDVLDFTQIQSGSLTLQSSRFSLTDLCATTMRSPKSKADAKQQRLSLHLPGETVQLQGDERRIHQALTNLLDNAIKFTPAGGAIDLEVILDPDKKQVRIRISDTGIGIQPENLAKLFQPFVQLDARLARMYEGTGLGLALVKGLVELHRGSVTVESEFGKGSCFTVTLPWEG